MFDMLYNLAIDYKKEGNTLELSILTTLLAQYIEYHTINDRNTIYKWHFKSDMSLAYKGNFVKRDLDQETDEMFNVSQRGTK